MKRTTKGGSPAPRNPVARAPLLRKGGPHQESKSSRRRRARNDVERDLAEWRRKEA